MSMENPTKIKNKVRDKIFNIDDHIVQSSGKEMVVASDDSRSSLSMYNSLSKNYSEVQAEIEKVRKKKINRDNLLIAVGMPGMVFTIMGLILTPTLIKLTDFNDSIEASHKTISVSEISHQESNSSNNYGISKDYDISANTGSNGPATLEFESYHLNIDSEQLKKFNQEGAEFSYRVVSAVDSTVLIPTKTINNSIHDVFINVPNLKITDNALDSKTDIRVELKGDLTYFKGNEKDKEQFINMMKNAQLEKRK